MAAPYTLKSLTQVKDSAPDFGLEEFQETRFAARDLDAEQTGFTLQRIKPGARPGFAHRHERAEEVYVVVSGSGRVKLDDEVVEIATLDAIRVAPEVTRSFEAGPDGMDVIAFGPRHDGDGEAFFDWWKD
jgi:mannose-6-phosphate isomerase-like protein (cupin superfamily)